MVGSYVLIVLLLFSILGPWSSIAAANDGAAAPASSSAAAATTTKVPILLEPIVTLHSGVLPPDVCAGLIALGEAAGFPHEGESIDEYQDVEYKVSSQSIEVYERDKGITSPAIWEALLPWIPRMTQLVKKSIHLTDEPDWAPKLDWVFFRKYSPETERNSLLVHVDSNMHTLNIALNDDYTGGGLLYVRPPALLGFDEDDDRPNIPSEYQDYRWLKGVRRRNTSDVVFPDMRAGDVLIHNFTVWHAVAPIEVGTRYSFVLFYDMDNPTIQRHDFNAGDQDREFRASFYHDISDAKIDLVWVREDANGDEVEAIVTRDMPPFEDKRIKTWVGHKFRALVSGENTLVSEFVMKAGRRKYRIRREEELHNEEL